MLALRSSPPSFTPAEGERIARDHFGLAVDVRPLSGERDCNFRLLTADGRDFLLKIIDLASDTQGAECLVAALAHLNEQDSTLPVPRLHPAESGDNLTRFVRDGERFGACLLSFLPGRLLIEHPPSEALLQQVGATLGRVDQALRGFFHAGLSRSLAWDLRRLPELIEHAGCLESTSLRSAVDHAASRMRELAPALRALRSQAIHGDCHASNLLVDESGETVMGLLDFGDMLHAPVVFEPAIAMSELMLDGVPLEEITRVLIGFARQQRLEAADIDVLTDLIAARFSITLLLHAWRTRHDPHGAELLGAHAAHAGSLLQALLATDREALTVPWHAAAGTKPRSGTAAVSLTRRRRLMGAGAELFYRTPLHLVRGEGVWLYDVAGEQYLDVYNNVPHVGHSHPHVARAIARQAAVLSTHTRYLHEDILRYAEALTARLPAHLDTCIFVNSGSEANDVAWRIAKMVTGRRGALVMSHAYHGITDAVGALTPGAGEPQDPWVAAIGATAPDPVAETEAAIATLAARTIEPAAWYIDSGLTSSGIFDPQKGWAQAIAARVRTAGGLIVADEVQYGLGRSGSHFWGFERRGLSPDVVTLGKPVGNGFPIGVVIANRSIVEAFQAKYGFFSTFGGNAVAAAAGLAVLEVIEQEGLQANAEDTGNYLRAALIELAARRSVFGEVRGYGLLLGLPVRADDAQAAKRRTASIVNALALEHRVLTGAEGPNGSVLKLRPPLPFRREHADRLIQALDAVAEG